MTGLEQSTYVDVLYNDAFYKYLEEQAKLAAPAVFDILKPIMKPRTVVDVGCGDGSWLRTANTVFDCEVLGVDGDWNTAIAGSGLEYLHCDLEKKLTFDRRFDLAICLEVVEHLSPDSGKALIHSLTEVSDVVLFSAAIVGQEGTNHINCQWQSFWAREFSKYDFLIFDIFRSALWSQKDIPVWYKQNMLLMVKRGTKAIDTDLLNQSNVALPLDLVHPQFYEEILYWRDHEYNNVKNRTDSPTASFVVRTIWRYIVKIFRLG